MMPLQVKYIEFKSRSVGPFITTLTDRPASFKAACHRPRQSADSNCSTRQLHIALITPHIAHAINFRTTTYKQKEIEGNYLPATPGLLTKK